MNQRPSTNHRYLSCVSFAAVGVATMHGAVAQTRVDRFYPHVVASGAKTTITAEGKFPTWPATVVSDRNEISVACEKEPGKLAVTVAENAAPGVVWLRLHDAKSASQLTPLIIAPITPTAEKEPNNKNTEANELPLPAVVVGKLQKSRDLDAYRIRVKAGERLIASVTANQVLRSPMDAVLVLADLQGNVLLQSEDVRGRDPQIVYNVTENEELLLRIYAFPEVPTGSVSFAGGSSFAYTIDVTTGPFLDHAFVLKNGTKVFGENLPDTPSTTTQKPSNISPATTYVDGALGWHWFSQREPNTKYFESIATGIKSMPVSIVGHINATNEIHRFRFNAKKGTKYRAEAFSKADGFLTDSKLQIFDAKTNAELASNDDISRGGYDAGTDFTAKQDGKIEVQVSDMVDGFGPRHAYELLIREANPTCRPTIDADHYALASGKTTEIAVTLNRDRGFSNLVRFTALSLPDGVTSEAVVSEGKGDTTKNVKLKLSAKEGMEFNGPFSIRGEILNKDKKPTGEHKDVVFQLRPSIPLNDIWLTVAK